MNGFNLSPADKENLKRLRIPLLLLTLSIGTGLGLYYGSGKMRDGAEARLTATQQKLAAGRNDRQIALTEQQEIRQYLPRYQRLVEEGLIGEAQRFELIDILGTVRGKRLLYPIEYGIDSPRPYAIASIPATGNLKIAAMPVSLRLSLLHEGDLADLLQDVRDGLKGMATVNRCELTRRDELNTAPALKENLSAECRLDWISLESPSSPGGYR